MNETPTVEMLRTEEMRLTQTFESEIAQLLKEPFHGVFGSRTFFQNRHYIRFTAHIDGILIGHLALGLRAVTLGDNLLDVIGIAEVGIDMAFRGQGIGRRLVMAALEEGRQSPASFALLFGDTNIYGGMGFAKASNPVTSTSFEAARTGKTITETEHPLMVCQLGDSVWNNDLPLDLAGFRF